MPENITDVINKLLQLESFCFEPYDRLNKNNFRYFLKKGETIVIEENKKIIAYIILRYLKNSINIYSLAVHPNHRKKGEGSFLLNEANERSLSFKKEINLYVRISNENAIGFYEKHGYKKVRIIPKYYKNGEDAIFMKKSLPVK